MTQTATVEKILERGQVLLSVARQTACAHDCEKCAGCGATAGAVRFTADDTVGDLRVGEKVLVTTENRQVIGIAAMVYLLPVLTFLVGYGLGDLAARRSGGYDLWLHVLVTVLMTILGFLPAFLYDRNARKKKVIAFTIVGRL